MYGIDKHLISLSQAPNTAITALARRLTVSAQAYDEFRTVKILQTTDYPGGIKRDFQSAVEYTKDSVIGAPWADDEVRPLEPGEFWNKGRRASLASIQYELDENGLPVNPFQNTGIKGRGIIGHYGPNHAVDIGLLTVRPDENDNPALHAIGIMKGSRPAFAGGFAEYANKDANGYVTGRNIWLYNQCKEFFEEMVSGSVPLIESHRAEFNRVSEAEIEQQLKTRKALSPDEIEEIRTQIETGFKLKQVQVIDPGFLQRVNQFFSSGIECYAGPLKTSNRNTNTSWMEAWLSWKYIDDGIWDSIRGENPAFNYQLSAGDDADDVKVFKIEPALLEKVTGTHAAMFVYMAASFLLDQQSKGLKPNANIIRDLEVVADFLEDSQPTDSIIRPEKLTP